MSQPDLFNSFTKTNHRQPYPAISPSLAPLSAKNKTILITGGSQGIGLAIAKAFAIAGASHIVLLARREGPLDAAKIDIEAESPSTKVHTFAADITDLEHAKKVFTLFPDPDVLVLCAGYLHHTQPALKVPLEDVRASFEINVIGNMALVQAYLAPLLSSPSPLGDETPQTLAAKQRTILNITTSVSQFPMPGMSIYGSSKGALVHLLGHVQNEYGSEGVHVRNIHPGHIYTRLLENHGMSEDFWSWDTIDLGGHATVWLASEEANFLDGRLIWAQWDVDELKARADEIKSSPYLLKCGIIGEPVPEAEERV